MLYAKRLQKPTFTRYQFANLLTILCSANQCNILTFLCTCSRYFIACQDIINNSRPVYRDNFTDDHLKSKARTS